MKPIPKEELLSEIQECYDKYGYVNRATFNDDSEFSSGKTIYNKFGSFADACEKAGVPHNNKPQKKEKVDIECLQCGEVRKVYPYRAEQDFPNGTSETCKYCMDKKVKTECAWCGEDLIRMNCLFERSENHFCTDKDCFAKWRSENFSGENHPNYTDESNIIHKYGSGWRNIREEVIQRDNEKCTECGLGREEHKSKYGGDIHVHHIVPRERFISMEGFSLDDANDKGNLQTVCCSCHRRVER